LPLDNQYPLGVYYNHMRPDIKKRAERRLKIIGGQIRGLEKMLKDEKYCLDIIHQSWAIKEALASLEDLILENHLSTHIAHQFEAGQKSKAIKEMLAVYQSSKRVKGR